MIIMVVRARKRSRKYLGTRTWGGGNKKNRRGSGSRGGVGKGGRKGKFTRLVKYEKSRIRSPGFRISNRNALDEISLTKISVFAEESKDQKPTLEFRGYKVLSNGSLSKPAIVKASAFSKKAEEKIKGAGGEAVKLE